MTKFLNTKGFSSLVVVLVVLGVLVVGGAGYLLIPRYTTGPLVPAPVSSFEECVAQGNPVMESYPRQCRYGEQTFIEQIKGNLFDDDEVGEVEVPLTFTISLDEEKYSLGSPIIMLISGVMQNTSRTNQIVNTRFSFPGPDVFIHIRPEAGEVLPWLPPSPPRPLTQEDFRGLEPDGQTEFTLTIRGTSLYEKLQRGRYIMRAKYRNLGDVFDLGAWKGEVYSNEIDFEVE